MFNVDEPTSGQISTQYDFRLLEQNPLVVFGNYEASRGHDGRRGYIAVTVGCVEGRKTQAPGCSVSARHVTSHDNVTDNKSDF